MLIKVHRPYKIVSHMNELFLVMMAPLSAIMLKITVKTVRGAVLVGCVVMILVRQ